jgi:hypothetical protein
MRSDEHNGGEVAAAVTPPKICTRLTLFQIEEGIALLAESAEEEGLTPEIERALAAYLEGALEKRDRVAEFILYCEGMAALAKSEVQRLQARQKHFESTAERVRSMALRVLECLGVTKLEGRTHTLKKRKCPASVALWDEIAVPTEYKRVTVVLPLPSWEKLLASVTDEIREQVRARIVKQETAVNLAAVKEALSLETPVPGTDLLRNRFTLQIG